MHISPYSPACAALRGLARPNAKVPTNIQIIAATGLWCLKARISRYLTLISAVKSSSGPLSFKFYLKVYGCAVRNEFYWQTTNQKAAILRIIHIWSWSLIIIVKVTNTSLLTLLCLNHENSKQGKCFSKWLSDFIGQSIRYLIEEYKCW